MTLRHIPAPLPLILASTSPFRKSVLSRLPIPFETFAPAVDETARPEERPAALVSRLAELKAKSAKTTYPQALIIGSDQVAVIDDTLLGKPGNHEQAVKQLNEASGKQVDFLTGLCLLNTNTNQLQLDVVRFSVKFRQLTASQIENYLYLDKPYNCSGSFKSEGLGIALLERMIGSDPTAIIGLPLIRLVRMLEAEGIQVF
ncbi:MAG: septum formation inhibitor Maf [Gammaproteobacteria bacterium]|nr:MAG: septum formation inhibitor Maf [Gammaproteobacteria bacterium]RKZ42616.1 MAG: septum formation inhibitor Maf [Gammaproteobacteria bacterium]RKZ76690.1 MAG: septum formation inhibitor Maf [Gammaproteobacteria bacterium]